MPDETSSPPPSDPPQEAPPPQEATNEPERPSPGQEDEARTGKPAPAPETAQPEIAPTPEAPQTEPLDNTRDKSPQADSTSSPQALQQSSGQAISLDETRDESAPEAHSTGSGQVPSEAVEAPRVDENLEAVIDTPKDKELPMGQTPKNEDISGQAPKNGEDPVKPETATGESISGQAPQSDSTPAQSPNAPNLPHVDISVARAKIQQNKRDKLEKIMAKLSEMGNISNDEVERLLRVSDATATRYLDALEKEGRLRQEGKTGRSVVYVKI